MPKNKLQEVIFSLLMVLAMVYAMVCYNIALAQGGLHNAVFLLALRELPIMAPVAFALEVLVVGRLARRMALRLVCVERDPQILVTLAVSSMTVCLMCPLMSLFSVALFQHPGVQLPAAWLQSAALSFPMALCWQLFFAGPAVRFVFRLLFCRPHAVLCPNRARSLRRSERSKSCRAPSREHDSFFTDITYAPASCLQYSTNRITGGSP